MAEGARIGHKREDPCIMQLRLFDWLLRHQQRKLRADQRTVKHDRKSMMVYAISVVQLEFFSLQSILPSLAEFPMQDRDDLLYFRLQARPLIPHLQNLQLTSHQACDILAFFRVIAVELQRLAALHNEVLFNAQPVP